MTNTITKVFSPTKQTESDLKQLTEKIDALELGFMNRSLAQIGLPHSNIGETHFSRSSGLVRLSITSGEHGLPYGSYPRLLLAWICTEAVRTQNQTLQLGTNQTEFLKKLSIQNAGSTIAIMREQSNRLLTSMFKLTYADHKYRGFANLILASEGIELWKPFEGTWEAEFKLSTEFFEDIINNPVPIDLNVLNAIRKSPMAMDVYTWIAYRSYLVYKSGKRPVKIAWEDLRAQFGSNYGFANDELDAEEILKLDQRGLYDFKRYFILSLKRLSEYYPELRSIVSAYPDHLVVGGAKLIS
ncbi:replication protein RepA [Oligella urethralis]|uniref:Plasmid encoded RepA protein n=1 Tax=Oligella urethralis TaxID=90245 RepID=A0A2X1UMX9_9BURK|nr:replication protein RepA [Oligella urethralis]SPY08418.1 Plasmid encoded RepA protein [Oligella urethralis]